MNQTGDWKFTILINGKPFCEPAISPVIQEHYSMQKRRSPPPKWIRPGVRVNYHPVIGKEPTRFDLKVSVGPEDFHGIWVVWLEGKDAPRGCVSVDAVSKAENPT